MLYLVTGVSNTSKTCMKLYVIFFSDCVFKYVHFNIGRSGGSGNFMGRGGNYGGGSGGGGGGSFGRGKCLCLTKQFYTYIYTVFHMLF